MEPQKRTRKKKELPKWSQSLNPEATIDKILFHGALNVDNSSLERILTQDIVMTPYSDYIPIHYLDWGPRGASKTAYGTLAINIRAFLDPGSARTWYMAREEDRKRAQLICSKFLESPSRTIFSQYINKEITLERVKEYLNYDDPISVMGFSSWGGNTNEKALNHFKGEYGHVQLRMRSFTGIIGNHMILLNDISTLPIVTKPVIVLTIPRNLFAEVRLQYCLTGEIDLSKCILFIDRDIDGVTFRPIQFRNNTYKNYLKPYLDTLKVETFKVPVSFIKEKCFLGNYKLKESNPIKRKKEKEDIISEFYRVVKEKYRPAEIRVEGGRRLSDIAEGLYEEMRARGGGSASGTTTTAGFMGAIGTVGVAGIPGGYVMGVDPVGNLASSSGVWSDLTPVQRQPQVGILHSSTELTQEEANRLAVEMREMAIGDVMEDNGGDEIIEDEGEDLDF